MNRLVLALGSDLRHMSVLDLHPAAGVIEERDKTLQDAQGRISGFSGNHAARSEGTSDRGCTGLIGLFLKWAGVHAKDGIERATAHQARGQWYDTDPHPYAHAHKGPDDQQCANDDPRNFIDATYVVFQHGKSFSTVQIVCDRCISYLECIIDLSQIGQKSQVTGV
jgi:hypothetical protein